MSKTSPRIIAGISFVAFLVVYTLGYFTLPYRDNGRARNAGAFFHYRIFNHDWEGYLYIPAGWIESVVIRLYPKPFLPNPSWATEPQVLFIQIPDGNFRFGNLPEHKRQ